MPLTKHKIYNLIILDESGSMESIKSLTINGFNEVAQTVKGVEKQFPEQEHFISLVSFNGLGIKTILDKQAIAKLNQIDEKTYLPDSSTPLFDAIGFSVGKLKNDLIDEKGFNVLVTILTDGEENSSKEYNGNQIRRIIEEQKKQGWTFTYIGANQDVEKVALSINITNSMQFEANEADMKVMFEKEKAARVKYSKKIQDKEDTLEGFYT
jgi:hypothetical protein